MPGSLRIGKIAGISIEINASWLIILALLTASLAVGWYPAQYAGFAPITYWILGGVSAILLFASVLAHELAHSFVARARGLPVKSITLFVFGGVSNIEQEPRDAKSEFQIAVVGPLTSLVIGGIAWALAIAIAIAIGSGSLAVAAVLLYLGIANVLLGLFNLIPGFPLDGGRILRAIVWKITGSLQRATRWASLAGQGVAILFILWGILQFFDGNFLGGIWIGFIGWFLLTAAQSANTQVQVQTLLHGARVAGVMQPHPLVVSPYLSVQELVDDYFLRQGVRAAGVVWNERLIGLVTLTDVRRVQRTLWAFTQAGQIMTPRERLRVATPGQDLESALKELTGHDINQLPVLDGDQLSGMLSRDAILRYLQVRRQLAPEPVESDVNTHLPRAG